MTMLTAVISSYYTVLIAYIVYFFFASMTDKLPWEDCENLWNTPQCLTTEEVANKTFLEYYLSGRQNCFQVRC